MAEKHELIGLPGLRTVREIRGLKGYELAEIVGLSAAMISDLENGKKDPSHETMHRLANALGCTLDQLSSKPGQYPKPLSDFIATLEPGEIKNDEVEALRLIRLPGRRITVRAYNNLLDALRNSEKMQ